jgi:tetratricopeptide (TPR) repeat protein
MKPRNRYLLCALALVVLTLAAYANSFDGGFVLDNRGLILNDARIREASAENIGLIFNHTYWWPHGESGLYRPFTTLTYLFNYAVLGNGEQPGGYHWINFLLHAGNVLLAFTLAVRLLRRFWQAFFVAAIWAVHPVLTESVTNIVGRADLLGAAGVLGGLLLYLKSIEAKGWRRVAWLGGLVLVAAMGAFSKESAVILPAAIVLYEVTFRTGGRWGRAQFFGLLATLVPVAIMLIQRSRVLAGTLPMEIPFTDNPIVGADFIIRRLTALKVIAEYFRLMAWPAHLSADYSWAQIPLSYISVEDWVTGMAVLAIIPATVFLYRWNRGAFFFFCVGMAWLAPSANILFPIGTIMAERLLYLPALGLIACVVPPICAIVERVGLAKYAPALLCVLTAALAARTWVRNADWKDDMSIATASVLTSPRSFKTHDLLANVLFASDASHGNLDRVIEESEKSMAILDPLPDERKPAHVYRFAATCYLEHKDYGKAIDVLRRYIAIEKADLAGFKRTAGGISTNDLEHANNLRQADAYLLLSIAYLATGDANQASDTAARSRSLDAFNPRVYLQMAQIAASAGRLDDAAVRLVEGEFVTSDRSLRAALVELYEKAMAPGSCALTPGPNGAPAINPRCPIVHAHVCAASAYAVQALAAAGQSDLAGSRKRMFIDQFGCPPGPLDQVIH